MYYKHNSWGLEPTGEMLIKSAHVHQHLNCIVIDCSSLFCWDRCFFSQVGSRALGRLLVSCKKSILHQQTHNHSSNTLSTLPEVFTSLLHSFHFSAGCVRISRCVLNLSSSLSFCSHQVQVFPITTLFISLILFGGLYSFTSFLPFYPQSSVSFPSFSFRTLSHPCLFPFLDS